MAGVTGGVRSGDHPSRWLALVSMQATSLLLVLAVVLLAYVTIQTRNAADSAKAQSDANHTIIVQQDDASKHLDVLAREAAVTRAKLAAATAAQLLADFKVADAASSAQSRASFAQLEANLLVAIGRLQDAIEQLAQVEGSEPHPTATRTVYLPAPKPSATPSPSPAPKPTPTCAPVNSRRCKVGR